MCRSWLVDTHSSRPPLDAVASSSEKMQMHMRATFKKRGLELQIEKGLAKMCVFASLAICTICRAHCADTSQSNPWGSLPNAQESTRFGQAMVVNCGVGGMGNQRTTRD
jgi:hypothetical protein